MNVVHASGNIGSEPELTVFQSGKKKARFSIAVNSSKKNKPIWVQCEIWEEACDRLLKCQEKSKLTGRKIQVSGSLALNEYKKAVGETMVNMRHTYVKVHNFELFGLKQEDQNVQPADDHVAPEPETEDYMSA
jgi:single-stranded DNA-binding protein